MGALPCRSRSKKSIHNLSTRDENEVNTLNSACSKYYDSFKHSLLESLPKKIPCGSSELQKIISTLLSSTKTKLLAEQKASKNASIKSTEVLYLFDIKCRALEGYFRYLNDYTSLQYSNDIKERLICEYIEEGLEKSACLENYYKLAKGTFELQGYQEMKKVLDAEGSQMMFYTINTQYEENMNKLKKTYSELISAQVVDAEVYCRTVGILHGDREF